MRKTIIIIVVVGMIGLLNYGLRQHASAVLKPAASSGSSNNVAAAPPKGGYKDGTFTGSAEYNPYGTVQVAAVIKGGKITDINYIQMPQDTGHSIYVTQTVEPILKQETLAAQSANVDFISGATYTSQTYQASLQSALDQAAGGQSQNGSSAGSTNSQTAPPAQSSPYLPSGGEGE